jgi:ribosomal protein S6--L-glutamate ligase
LDQPHKPAAGEGQGIRIGVIAERRYLAQAQPRGMMAALEARGNDVVLIDPEGDCYEPGRNFWLAGLDLVIARGRSWGVLCLLSWVEGQGVQVINSRASIAAVHNKADMAVALAGAGIPTPRTLLGGIAHIADSTSASDYPLILKPVFGDNCKGLRIVSSREELLSLNWPEPFALAQAFIPGSEYDLKLYCIGSEVWAVHKPSLLYAAAEQDQPVLLPATPALRALARRCGEVFGLEIFGVDCINTPSGPVVIEVNEFPNYSAVPEAGARLAEYVMGRARQEVAA